MYDFNLNQGDTLPYTYNNQYEIIIVSSIDSVLVGNQYRKRFILEDLGIGAPEIIEGIGSNTGLLEPLLQFEDNYGLNCFNLNDSIYYPEYGYLCDLITGINEMNAFIEIINVWGQPVSRFPINNQSSIPITGNIFIPGFYFCVLKSKDNSVLQITKFVCSN